MEKSLCPPCSVLASGREKRSDWWASYRSRSARCRRFAFHCFLTPCTRHPSVTRALFRSDESIDPDPDPSASLKSAV